MALPGSGPCDRTGRAGRRLAVPRRQTHLAASPRQLSCVARSGGWDGSMCCAMPARSSPRTNRGRARAHGSRRVRRCVAGALSVVGTPHRRVLRPRAAAPVNGNKLLSRGPPIGTMRGIHRGPIPLLRRIGRMHLSYGRWRCSRAFGGAAAAPEALFVDRRSKRIVDARLLPLETSKSVGSPK